MKSIITMTEGHKEAVKKYAGAFAPGDLFEVDSVTYTISPDGNPTPYDPPVVTQCFSTPGYIKLSDIKLIIREIYHIYHKRYPEFVDGLFENVETAVADLRYVMHRMDDFDEEDDYCPVSVLLILETIMKVHGKMIYKVVYGDACDYHEVTFEDLNGTVTARSAGGFQHWELLERYLVVVK